MPDLSPVGSPAVQRCWRIMTRLHVASRVEAIEFLQAAQYLPRLSIGEIRSLVNLFPLMPADQNGTVRRFDLREPVEVIATTAGVPVREVGSS